MVHACGTPGLSLLDQVGCYCERGLDPSLWAEPLNALSNAGFFIAAALAWRLRAKTTRGDPLLYMLIALVAVVGLGSVLFHTLATRWAALADVIPIGAFVFAYVAVACVRLLGLPALGALPVAMLVTLATFAMPSALNGSTLYLPALAAMAVAALLLWWWEHAAWRPLAVASGTFVVSLALRTFDRSPLLCGGLGMPGSHWLWHLLNAAVLYLLLRAVIDHGVRAATTRTN